MRKFLHSLNFLIFVTVLILLSLLIQGRCAREKNTKIKSQEYPGLLGKKVILNINEELANHQYSKKSISLSQYLSSYKMIRVIEINCSSCYLALQAWINYFSDHSAMKEATVIFFAYGEINEAFRYSLENESFPFIIIWDSDSSFLFKNDLAKYGLSNFILDSNNQVVQVGDPLEVGFLHQRIKKAFK